MRVTPGRPATRWHTPVRAHPRTDRALRAMVAGVTLASLLWVALAWAAPRLAVHVLGEPQLSGADETSVVLLDRRDRLLRAFTTGDGRWRLPVDQAHVDPRYLAMLIAYEDHRFRSHAGVDVTALLRAAVQLARNGRIVSGASTLTMQVARLLEARHERSGSGKLRQMLRAVQLEHYLEKNEILDLYLLMAPFGGNIEGARAAALTYFGKEPRRLSVAEAALLVALPQSPKARRPDRHPIAARRARDRVIDRMVGAGVVSPAEAAAAKAEPVPTSRKEFPRHAPHLAEAEVAAEPQARVHRLTLDASVQGAMETLAREHVRGLGSRLSVAILVVEQATGEVIAHVGSSDYLDETRFGSIDMVRAVRSPGSALKPFIYGLAFEQGLAHPDTLIEDRPVRFGSYSPKNFDQGFHGTVTIREALQQSLNIPAVKVLAKVGPQALIGRFRRLRMVTALPDHTEPSLAIALGGVGMRLWDLTALYASLARGGEAVRLIHRQSDRPTAGGQVAGARPARRLLSPVAAWYVSNILAGTPPPENAKAGAIAYKTGTSYGYRDAWSVGFDGRNTIAVWVGRPDGASTPGLTGRTAAAPILFDAFQRLGRPLEPLPPAPAASIHAEGSALPPPLRRFRHGGDETAAGSEAEPAVLIAFPLDRTELEVEQEAGDERPQIQLKAEGGALPLTWLADGKPIASAAHAHEATFEPQGKGFFRLSVIDARGAADSVTVRVR
jgi:penicillin-binding protein 1C